MDCESADFDIQCLEELRARLIEDYNIAHNFDGYPLPNWFADELKAIDEQLDALYRFEALNCSS